MSAVSRGTVQRILWYRSQETYVIPLNSADILCSSLEAAAQRAVKHLCTVLKLSVQSPKNVCVLSVAFLNKFRKTSARQ